MSRAFARHGVRPEQEVELAEDLWAITIDPQRALEEWLGKQLGGGPGGPDPRPLARVPVLRRGRAGRQGADHDRQGLGARAAAALGPAQPRLRPRRRRRARLRPRDRHAHHAADVRRDRPRGADPPPGDQGLRHARRPGAYGLRRGRAAGGDAGQRDDRARAAAARRGRARARRDRDERDVAGALLLGRRDEAARRRARRPAGRARRRARRAGAHERVKAQRVHVRRLEAADGGADPARCRSSSSPSSSSTTTSTSPLSWAIDARPRAPPLPLARRVWRLSSLASGRRAASPPRSCRSTSTAGPLFRIVPLSGSCSAPRSCRRCAGRAGAGTSATRASTSATARSPIRRTLVPWVRVPARRHAPRAVRAGLRALDRRRPHRRRQPHDPAAAAAEAESCASGSPGSRAPRSEREGAALPAADEPAPPAPAADPASPRRPPPTPRRPRPRRRPRGPAGPADPTRPAALRTDPAPPLATGPTPRDPAPSLPPPTPPPPSTMPETRRLHRSAVVIYSAAALRNAAFPLHRARRDPLFGGRWTTARSCGRDLRRHRPGDLGHRRRDPLPVDDLLHRPRGDPPSHRHLRTKDTDVRLDRIQAIDVHQGPLQRAVRGLLGRRPDRRGREGRRDLAAGADPRSAVGELRAARPQRRPPRPRRGARAPVPPDRRPRARRSPR